MRSRAIVRTSRRISRCSSPSGSRALTGLKCRRAPADIRGVVISIRILALALAATAIACAGMTLVLVAAR
jgi:hypothetical protein